MRGVLGAGVLAALGRRGKRGAGRVALRWSGAVLAVAVALLSSGDVSRAQQTESLLVSNTSYGISGAPLPVIADHLAVGFTAGRDSGGYALTALDVRFAFEPTTELSRVKLSLWTSGRVGGSSGPLRPNRKMFEFDNPESFKTGNDQFNTFTPPEPVYLHDGRSYFLVAESEEGNILYSLTATESDNQAQPQGDSGWSIFDAALYWNGSGPWPETVNASWTRIPVFTIWGYDLDRLTTNLHTDHADDPHDVGGGDYLAQGFGFGLTSSAYGYDLHSVAVSFERFATQPGVPEDPEDITVSLYTQKSVSGDWVPDQKLFDFHDPPVFREGGDNAFPAPEGTTLAPFEGGLFTPFEGYLIVIKHESGHTILVRNTYSNDEGGHSEFFVRDEAQQSSNGTTWREHDRPAQIAVYGNPRTEPIPEPLVTNHGEPDTGSKGIVRGSAQGFVTGDQPNGYELSEVTINMNFERMSLADDAFAVELWDSYVASGNDAPNARLFSFALPSFIADGSDQNTFTAPAGNILFPETTYFIVIRETTSFDVSFNVTNTNDEEASDSGWSINDNLVEDQSAGESPWSPTATPSQEMLIGIFGEARTSALPNTAPWFLTFTVLAVDENQTSAGTVTATDSDLVDNITGYAITGGEDQSFLSIGATSGVLTFDEAPNFEDPKDQNTDNIYMVEVTATSGTGTREMTGTNTFQVTVRDVDGEAPEAPDAPDVSSASLTSLTVTWPAPANEGPAITDYDVQYRAGTSGDWSDGNHDGAATTATLTGLSENTSYQVQVRAKNAEGTGDWSDSGTGTTDANAAPSFTSSAFEAAENQTSAGTVVATDSDNEDEITGYAITGGADRDRFGIDGTSGDLTFLTAPNFEAPSDDNTDNDYEVRVEATSGTGGREKTATRAITVTVTDVDGEAPGKPAAPAVSAASVTSLTVTWSAPSNAGPAITDYDVQYQAGTSGGWSDGNHDGTARTATLSNLSENTSYQVQVRAKNAEGTGDWSDASSAVCTPAEIITPGDVGDVQLRERGDECGTAGDVIDIDVNEEVTGIVAIYYDDGEGNAAWRSVCDDFWSDGQGAAVVCRQLGYATGTALTGLLFGPEEPIEYWLDDVECDGSEATLLECPHAGIGNHNCGARERAGVTCRTDGSPPPPTPPRRPGGGGRGPACAADRHGNTAPQATALEFGTATAGAICPAADVDYFTVTAPDRGLVFVETTGSVNLSGTLWQNGEVLESGPTASQPTARLGARVDAGPVVVAVAGQGGATGEYALVVTFSPGFLENPGADSFQSGIGLISGWVCEAERVEIEIETAAGDTTRLEAAYGTERADTAQRPDGTPLCGDTANGFGLLFNWNLLGDGEHTVVALVEGVELDRATVTVTTLGAEFVEEAAGECVAEDFPVPDESVTLVWQESRQNFVLATGLAPAGENRAGTPGESHLENPAANSFQSGIGLISGWVCEADEVEIALGALGRQAAAYGTERLDTLDTCGDTDNGFGLLFNWNLLGAGEHEVVAYVDEVEFGRATVRVTTLGVEFVEGAAGACMVEDFPMLGETVTLEWQQTSQNFVMTDLE